MLAVVEVMVRRVDMRRLASGIAVFALIVKIDGKAFTKVFMPGRCRSVSRPAFVGTSKSRKTVRRFAAIDTVLAAFEFLFGYWHRNLSRSFTLSSWTMKYALAAERSLHTIASRLAGTLMILSDVGG